MAQENRAADFGEEPTGDGLLSGDDWLEVAGDIFHRGEFFQVHDAIDLRRHGGGEAEEGLDGEVEAADERREIEEAELLQIGWQVEGAEGFGAGEVIAGGGGRLESGEIGDVEGEEGLIGAEGKDGGEEAEAGVGQGVNAQAGFFTDERFAGDGAEEAGNDLFSLGDISELDASDHGGDEGGSGPPEEEGGFASEAGGEFVPRCAGFAPESAESGAEGLLKKLRGEGGGVEAGGEVEESIGGSELKGFVLEGAQVGEVIGEEDFAFDGVRPGEGARVGEGAPGFEEGKLGGVGDGTGGFSGGFESFDPGLGWEVEEKIGVGAELGAGGDEVRRGGQGAAGLGLTEALDEIPQGLGIGADESPASGDSGPKFAGGKGLLVEFGAFEGFGADGGFREGARNFGVEAIEKFALEGGAGGGAEAEEERGVAAGGGRRDCGQGDEELAEFEVAEEGGGGLKVAVLLEELAGSLEKGGDAGIASEESERGVLPALEGLREVGELGVKGRRSGEGVGGVGGATRAEEEKATGAENKKKKNDEDKFFHGSRIGSIKGPLVKE